MRYSLSDLAKRFHSILYALKFRRVRYRTVDLYPHTLATALPSMCNKLSIAADSKMRSACAMHATVLDVVIDYQVIARLWGVAVLGR